MFTGTYPADFSSRRALGNGCGSQPLWRSQLERRNQAGFKEDVAAAEVAAYHDACARAYGALQHATVSG